jgi:hypothetical protein
VTSEADRDPLPVNRELAYAPCPKEHTFANVEIKGNDTGETAGARGGLFLERTIGEMEGTWTHLDVHFVVPIAWVQDLTAVLRIYAVSEGVSSLVREGRFSAIFGQTDDAGTNFRGDMGARSRPSRGWKVTAATAGAGLRRGTFTMVAWGREAAGHEAAGESVVLGGGMPDGGFSPRDRKSVV